MLRVITKMGQLPFGALKQIYIQSNKEAANLDYPNRPDGLLQAEADFYDYLKNGFFQVEGAYYCLWDVNGKPVSALRLEPYRDGLRLTGLETDPEQRGMGYAGALMAAALASIDKPVYSHIERNNLASVRAHEKCGFKKITNFAVLLDGSVSQNADTYLRKFV